MINGLTYLGDWQTLTESVDGFSRVPDLRDFSFWRKLIDEGNDPNNLAHIHIYYWGVLMKSSPSDLSDIKTGVDIGIQILSRDIMPALSDLITKLKNNEQFDFGQWLTKTGTALIATGASAVGAGVISIVNLIGESKRQGDVREARVRAEDLLGRYRQLYYMYAGLKPMTDFFYEKGLMVRNFYLKYILREPDALYTNIVNALYHGEMSDSGARDFIMNSAPAQELRAKGIPPDERDWFQLDGVDTSGVMNTGDMLPAIVAVGAGMIASLV